MSQKTLRELLRRGGREQINYDPAQPAITPTITKGAGAQYSISTQGVPQSNAAIKLAQALQGINPILRNVVEAQQEQTATQNIEFDERLAAMDLAEKKRLAEQSEAEINSIFRNDYKLNPIATIRATKLLGATKAPDYGNYYKQRKEEFIAEYVEKTGTLPSSAQISAFIDQVTDEFVAQEGNENIAAAGLARDGFMDATDKFRNEKRQQLFTEAADAHKKNVLIPSVGKRMKDLIDPDLPELTEDSQADIVSQYGDILNTWVGDTGPLNKTEQQAAIVDFVLRFPEDEYDEAADALQALAASGVRIGNEKLIDSGFYIDRLDELERKGESYRRGRSAENSALVDEKSAEYFDTFNRAFNVDKKGVAEADEILEEYRDDINSNPEYTLEQKRLLNGALETQYNAASGRVNKELKDVADRIPTWNLTNNDVADDFESVADTVIGEFSLDDGEETTGSRSLGVPDPNDFDPVKTEYIHTEETKRVLQDAMAEWESAKSDLNDEISRGDEPIEVKRNKALNTLRAKKKELKKQVAEELRAIAQEAQDKEDNAAAAEQKRIEEEAKKQDRKDNGLKFGGLGGPNVVSLPNVTVRPNTIGGRGPKIEKLDDLVTQAENSYLHNPDQIPEGTEEDNLLRIQQHLEQNLSLHDRHRSELQAKLKSPAYSSRHPQYKEELEKLRKDYFRAAALSGTFTAEDLVEMYDTSRATAREDQPGYAHTEEGFKVLDVDAFAKSLISSGFIQIDQADEIHLEELADRTGMTQEEIREAQKLVKDKWLRRGRLLQERRLK